MHERVTVDPLLFIHSLCQQRILNMVDLYSLREKEYKSTLKLVTSFANYSVFDSCWGFVALILHSDELVWLQQLQ